MSRLTGFAAVAVALMALCVAGCKKNSAPEPPEVQGPGAGKPGATVAFGFTSTDPDGDDVWYMVSWGDGTTTDWSSAHPSGEQFVQTHVYPDSGAYFIKAKAKDFNQTESDWSGSVQLAVGLFAPDPPFRPSGPNACTTGVPYSYKARAVHPLRDSVAIQFYWGDTLGDWGPLVPSGKLCQATHVFDTAGTYMIAARARDARGLESAWSDSLKVVVGARGIPSRAPYNLTLTAATDRTVRIAWSAPADTAPDRYVVAFKAVGSVAFDSIGATAALFFLHDPTGQTGEYEVIAVYGGARYASSEAPSSTPVATGPLVVSELNGDSKPGCGWDRTSGEAFLYDMTTTDSAAKVDFYVTDFAQGYAGPDYYVASPDTAPLDPGGVVPAGYWHVTGFCHLDSLATEDSVLPPYAVSRYRRSSILDSLPRLVACYTEDGHYALVKATAVDTINGTANVETWFQMIPYLRLMQH